MATYRETGPSREVKNEIKVVFSETDDLKRRVDELEEANVDLKLRVSRLEQMVSGKHRNYNAASYR